MTLQVGALPATLTATVAPIAAQPGESVTITVTSDPATALDDYSIPLIGSSGVLTDTASLKVTVVEQVHEQYLPSHRSITASLPKSRI